jgi:hypothetical protein
MSQENLRALLTAARGVSPGKLTMDVPAASGTSPGQLTTEVLPATVSKNAPRIFISYRHDDSEGHTGRLNDELVRRFGEDNIFMDIDRIPLGADFTRVIAEAVESCDVLIAVIGRGWSTITDPTGQRRLDNPEDYVRFEIKTALERDIRVIPAFVQNAQMPPSDQLPNDLAGLTRRNGISLRSDNWHPGVERLIHAIDEAGRMSG